MLVLPRGPFRREKPMPAGGVPPSQYGAPRRRPLFPRTPAGRHPVFNRCAGPPRYGRRRGSPTPRDRFRAPADARPTLRPNGRRGRARGRSRRRRRPCAAGRRAAPLVGDLDVQLAARRPEPARDVVAAAVDHGVGEEFAHHEAGVVVQPHQAPSAQRGAHLAARDADRRGLRRQSEPEGVPGADGIEHTRNYGHCLHSRQGSFCKLHNRQ